MMEKQTVDLANEKVDLVTEDTVIPADMTVEERLLRINPKLKGRRLDRYVKLARTKYHTDHTPGAAIQMSRDRVYIVAKDGSYRKVK